MNLLTWLDQGAEETAARLHRPWLDPIAIAVTHLGDRVTLAAVLVAVMVVLLRRRLWRTAVILAVVALAGLPLSEGVKVLVDRPRPDVPWRVIPLPSSASFPSGHALESMAVYGAMALCVCRRQRSRSWRAAVFGLGLLLPLLIGLSRVYVGVHYFTDVLAGWAFGLTLALLAGWADRRRAGA